MSHRRWRSSRTSRAAPQRAALMADGHLGYVMPIGGVAAYREQVSVVGVGFDIACGNAAIRTDLTRAGSPDLINRLGAIADAIQDEISFGIGRKNRADDAPVEHPLFESSAWHALPNHAREGLRRQGPEAARHGRERQPLRGRVRG